MDILPKTSFFHIHQHIGQFYNMVLHDEIYLISVTTNTYLQMKDLCNLEAFHSLYPTQVSALCLILCIRVQIGYRNILLPESRVSSAGCHWRVCFYQCVCSNTHHHRHCKGHNLWAWRASYGTSGEEIPP